MKVDQILDLHVQSARMTLEERTAQGAPFAPMILPFRQNRMIAMIIPPDGDGAQIASTARLAVNGFDADMVLIVSDSYMAATTDMINPVTEKPWNHGDMEDLAANHHGLERGLITECLVVSAIRRGDTTLFRSLPYVREKDGTVTWAEERQYPGSGWQTLRGGRFGHVMQPNDRPMREYLRGIDSQEEVDELVCRLLMDPKYCGCAEVMLLQ